MNKKDFIFGLVTGFAIALTISMGIFNYYVVQKVEQTKREAQEGIEMLKKTWESEWRQEVTDLKEYAKQKAEEKGSQLFDNVAEQVKMRLNKTETVLDSTAVN